MVRFVPRLSLVSFLVLLGWLSSFSIAWAEVAEVSKLQGAWQEDGASRLLRFEPSRVIEFQSQDLDQISLAVKGIVRQERGLLLLRADGFSETWKLSFEGGLLKVEQVGQKIKATKTGLFRRLPSIPFELDLKAAPLGARRPLAISQVEEIQANITRRFQEEQELYKDKLISPEERAEKVAALKVANLAYLSGLVRDVGWIDADRFGSKVSVYAVILAKHAGDLRLMMAIVPEAKRDLEYSGEGQTWAVLYDSLQLELGGKQRYGTQIGEDENGEPFVLPLEDPARVDVYLNKMGLPPFKKYLSDVSGYFYSGRPIRLAKEKENR